MTNLLRVLLVTIVLIIPWSGSIYGQDDSPLTLPALTNQDIRFSHLTIDDGLSHNRVFAVAQDQAGFLWIGTTDGLNRYDGYDFQIYKSDYEDPNSLSDSYVRVLWVDKGGHIWIGTDLGGVNRFDPVTQTFSYYQHDPDDPNSLIPGKIFALFEDSSGLIWVSTENGLNSIEPASGEIRHYLHNPDDPNSISSNLIRYVYEDKNGEIWVATFGGGLNLFDREAGTFTHYRHVPDDPNSLCDDQTWTIMEDSFGVFWIGTLNGLYAWNPETGSGTCYKNDPDDPGSVGNDFAKAIYEDSTGALWIGTWGGGLNLFNRDSGEFIRYQHDPLNPSSLANDRITTIYEDEGGILWVGTVDGGLDKFDRSQQRFVRIQQEPDNPNSLDNNLVTALVETGNGDIWIGTDTSLNVYNRARGQFVHYRHDPLDPTTIEVSQRVHAIIEDHEGVIWVGTAGGGLNRFDPTTGGFHTYRSDPEDPHSLSSDQVHSIFEDSAGVLWVGMLRGGLAQFNPQTETVEAAYSHDPQDPHSLSDDTIDVIYEDQAGRLWLGTPSGGLNWFDHEKEQFGVIRHDPDNLESLSSDNINSIYQDSRGVLWVGTATGLNRIVITGNDLTSDLTVSRYTEKDGLPNNVIQSILEDDRGYLWLGTNRGISRFDPQAESFKNFTAADGLSGDEFQEKAAIRLNSGELLFGSSAGLTLFTPDKISDSPYLPPIKITNFKLLNKSVGLGDDSPLRNSIWETDQLSLSYQDDVITFEFAALSYAHPAGNQYQYMLEGFDDDWSPVSDQHSATYTNLDPGQYVFRVRGSNSHGVWNEAGTSIRLIIAPPWWQTWWFSGGILLLLIGLVAGGFVWQRQSAKRRQRHLEAKVLERTRALSFAEEQIRTLFESSQVGIALTTPEGKILAFNRALLHITGYSETEVLQHNVIDLYANPESRSELLAQLSTKAVENFGVAFKRKDGSPVSVSMNVSRIRRDGQEILLALIEDVTEYIQLTERLQAEIAMRKQTEGALYRVYNQQNALLEITQELRVTDDLASLLDRAMENLRYLVEAHWTGVMLMDKDGMLNTQGFFSHDGSRQLTKVQISVREIPSLEPILVRHELIYIPDLSTHSGILDELNPHLDEQWKALLCEARTWLGIPLVVQNRTIGLLNVLDNQPNQYDEKNRNLIQTFANHLAEAIVNAQHYAQAQDVAALEERNRLAIGLHDTVTQSLYSINLQSDATLMAISSGNNEIAKKRLGMLKQITREAMSEMRLLIHQLHPPVVEELGLALALQQRLDAVETRAGISADLQVEGDQRLPLDIEIALFQIALEGLNNVLKHAKASEIQIRLIFEADRCRLTIQDNGVGFEPESIEDYGGYGLASMRDRLEKINGTLTIDSQPGKGTTLDIEVTQ